MLLALTVCSSLQPAGQMFCIGFVMIFGKSVDCSTALTMQSIGGSHASCAINKSKRSATLIFLTVISLSSNLYLDSQGLSVRKNSQSWNHSRDWHVHPNTVSLKEKLSQRTSPHFHCSSKNTCCLVKLSARGAYCWTWRRFNRLQVLTWQSGKRLMNSSTGSLLIMFSNLIFVVLNKHVTPFRSRISRRATLSSTIQSLKDGKKLMKMPLVCCATKKW